MTHSSEVLVALNAGVFATTGAAFDRDGRELALVSVPTQPRYLEDGGVEQDLPEAWQAAVKTLRMLADEVPDLARRAAALAVTGHADGTWLVDEDGDPVAPALLWLDERPAPIVETWRRGGLAHGVHAITGSALAPARQSAQLAWLLRHRPDVVDEAASVLQGKDWLYLCCTGERVTDPASGISSYGSLESGAYDDRVLELLGLEDARRLLPPMVDGTRHLGRLDMAAAAATGLRKGTPVVLAPPDALAAALAAGAFDPEEAGGCTVLNDAALTLRSGRRPENALSLASAGGATVPFVVPGRWASMSPTVAAGVHADWLLALAWQLIADVGLIGISRRDLVAMLEARAAEAVPGALTFHPLLGQHARLAGRLRRSGLGELMRAIYEGLAWSTREAHATLGYAPREIRIGGALAASPTMRRVLAACLCRPVRRCLRRDAAAGGAALVAAVALGHYGGVAEALADWVEPHLAEPETVDADLAALYERLFETWRSEFEPLACQAASATA